MRNAAILSTEHVAQWLGGEPSEGNSSNAVVDLSKNPSLTLAHAEMVLYALRKVARHYPLIGSFLERYPSLLTSEHMEEMAADLRRSDEPGTHDWGVMDAIANVAVDYLLPRGALNPESMILAARFVSEYDKKRLETLARHPSTSPAVWVEMIARNKAGIIEVLLGIPEILANKEARQALVSDAESRTPLAMAELVRVFPLDAIDEPLARLARGRGEYYLKVLGELPAERRAAALSGATLGEIAATHPNADVRLTAILLSGTPPEGADIPARTPDSGMARR
jgi:hypothetical protein